MKLAIVGWRPWTLTQRYRSLIINAKALGHQVFGVVTNHFGDGPLMESLFHDLGVPTVRGSASKLSDGLEKFAPDAVFGECFWGEGSVALRWARRKGKRYFALDHGKIDGTGKLESYRRNRPPDTMLTTNETTAQWLSQVFNIRAFPVGVPQFDIDRRVDVDNRREELGASGQPMIGFFLDWVWNEGAGLEKERKALHSFLALADKKGWKVFLHVHPDEQSGKAKRLEKSPARRLFLTGLESRGAVFVSFLGGKFKGITFKHCGPLALCRSADAIVGTALSPTWTAYAAGKRYFWLGNGYSPEDLLPYPNLVRASSDFSEVLVAVENNSGSIKREAEIVRRWLHKLDGKCWQRILEVAGDS